MTQPPDYSTEEPSRIPPFSGQNFSPVADFFGPPPAYEEVVGGGGERPTRLAPKLTGDGWAAEKSGKIPIETSPKTSPVDDHQVAMMAKVEMNRDEENERMMEEENAINEQDIDQPSTSCQDSSYAARLERMFGECGERLERRFEMLGRSIENQSNTAGHVIEREAGKIGEKFEKLFTATNKKFDAECTRLCTSADSADE
ncbi:unnamed protein product, partial [Mesorhabditis belari]|uniref:Uncharacterized protein n=1 Tax=Mesorhabditis belari TaxID=2138241 RepID=A0AAF3FM67_9BILA